MPRTNNNRYDAQRAHRGGRIHPHQRDTDDNVARSSSIDPLSFANFRPGTDSIIGKYDDSKMDKAGERLSEKNIYANPNDFRLSYWTGMGIWIALWGNKFKGNNKLFLDKGVREGTSASKYCEQVSTLVVPYRQ